MSRHDHEESVEEEDFIPDEIPLLLQPLIFEGQTEESIPSCFNSLLINLDGHLDSDLEWKMAWKRGEWAKEHGYGIFWNLSLGLIASLPHPLDSKSQFLTLTLALEHFRDTLWKEFKSETQGLILYRSSADFTENFPWTEEQEENLKQWLIEREYYSFASLSYSQLLLEKEGKRVLTLFCRDVALEYLSFLAARLPDPLPLYLYLDLTSLGEMSHVEELQYLNPERFERFHLVVKGSHLRLPVLGWDSATEWGYSGVNDAVLPEIQKVNVGICVPTMLSIQPFQFEGFEVAMQQLKQKNIATKFIAESELTGHWDGLDILLYFPHALSPQGKRKLLGFCAAGGTILPITKDFIWQ